jgi:toluene monooxygenase system ferredoxin subunit
MAFEKLCHRDDVAPGAMAEFSTHDGTRILVVRQSNGDWSAFQALCPHAAVALAAGTFDGSVLTCREHWWQFDGASGEGTNPTGCHLARYPLRLLAGDVCVDVAGVVPFKAGPGVS